MKKTTGKVVISSLMVLVFLISTFVPMSVALSQDGGLDPTLPPTGEVQPTPETTPEGEIPEPTLPPTDLQLDPTPEPTAEPTVEPPLPTEIPSPTAPPDSPIVPVAENEPEDVSHLINISATVSQDLDGDYIWEEVADGGTIDGTAPIQAAFSFAIPVSGDGFADAYAIHQGDYATVMLSNAFSVYDDLYIPQYYGDTYVGSVTISSDGWNTYANIAFDGDEVIFNSPSVAGVSAWFYADMFYNGHAGSDPWGTELRTMLDKSYYVVVESDETEYRITDIAAEATLDGNTNRTVLVEAFQSATIAGSLITRYVSLENYTFVYNLEPFGAFIDGSFLLEGLIPVPSAVLEGYNLTYTFPAGAANPATISFTTEGFDGTGLSDLMLPSDMTIMPFAIGDGNDVTTLLQGTGFEALVLQDLDGDGTWETVADGGTIDGTKPVRIELDFNIPVEGDDPLPAEVVKKWDYALFPISNSFTVHSAATIPLLFNEIPVGTVSFPPPDDSDMTFARVDFDGDDIIFTPSGGQAIFGVSAGFNAYLDYNGHGGGDPWGTQDVELLERAFEVSIGTDETVYSLVKTATELTSDRKIRWSVVIDGTQTVTVAGDTLTRHVSLEGYKFVDDLTAVGRYVANSFQLGSVAPVPTATLTDDMVLNYTFPTGTTGPVTITFETEIPDDKYFASGPQSITNKGELYDDTKLITSGEVTHPFTPPTWITKTGVAGNEMIGGVYDPTDRTITWTIEFNHAATALKGVKIRDTLSAGLGFDSAKWFTESSGTPVWAGTWTSEPTDGLYDIGDITQKGRLVIVSRVLNTDPTMDITTYYNTASIISTDFPSGTGGPGEIGIAEGGQGVGVPIGFTSLTKSGTRITPNIDRKVLWTVSFDPRGQTIENLKIYDLIVHGSSFSCGSVTGIPAGVTCGNLTPRYGQQYVAGTFAPVSGVNAGSVTVLPISQGGTQIADLLEVTLPNSGISSFTFQTQVLDPAIFASNGSVNARNTATLIQFNNEGIGTTITSASAAVPFESSVLAKSLLHRDEVAKAYDAINPTKTASNAADGFNYQEKAAIFQLRVNADGFDWAKILNGQGLPLGDVTVTDTLPSGWEFMNFSNGAQYLIYPAAGTTPVTVTGLTPTFSGQTATFTFSDLDQPYYILIKAKPNDATLSDYLVQSTQPITRTNNVNLRVPGWDGVNASHSVSINARALDKTAIETVDNAVQWNVVYNPFGLVKGNKLEDALPEGVDLRMDSGGRLILTGNITAVELTLNADGTFTDGAAVTLSQDAPANIWYDNATRTLHFVIPDENKAYRLSYITDVTGLVQGTISNSVKLFRTDGGEVGDNTSFDVLDRHGQATMGRYGWIQILKRNAQGENLAGATFTLYAAESNTIIRQGTSNSSGLIRIMGIPVGVYRLIETTPPNGFLPDDTVHIVRVETLEGGAISTSIDDRTGENTHMITLANYRAEDEVGRLRVVKTVAGTNAENDKLFTFTLTLSETSGEYTYVGTGGAPGGTISGGTATFSLSHGQGITVVGLPAGTTYTVTENSYASDGYQTVSSGATGTIVAEQTQLADFTNTRNLPGELTINKRVEGAVIDPAKTFIFTVTFDTPVTPPVGGYPYIGSGGVADGFISSGGTIALAHGQGITIQALPEGTTYTVVENDYSGDGYVTQSAGATGTIGTQTGSTAAFTNFAPGQMTISKRVEGAGFDPARTFVFTVLFAPTVAAPAGGYPYIGNGVPNGTISSGGTIALAHGQSITITNLPVGTVYGVLENDYSGDGYVTQSTGAAGTISNEASVVFTAAFTNLFPGRLTISKRVEGGTIEANKQFEFTVTFNSPVPQPLAGYPFTGNGVPNGTIRSGDTIRLAHNQSITITGLAVGTQYQVSERNYSSDGYITESSGATGTISNQTVAGHTAAFTNITSGSLSIRKTVQGNESNRSDRFEFVVSFPDLPSSISFSYTGHGVANGSIMNHGSIWLSHGQSITIEDIPARSRYQVIERGFSGYTSTSVASTGTIVAGSGVTADFVNTKGKVDYNPNTGDSNRSTRALFAMVYFALLLATLLGLDIYFVQRNRQRG